MSSTKKKENKILYNNLSKKYNLPPKHKLEALLITNIPTSFSSKTYAKVYLLKEILHMLKFFCSLLENILDPSQASVDLILESKLFTNKIEKVWDLYRESIYLRKKILYNLLDIDNVSFKDISSYIQQVENLKEAIKKEILEDIIDFWSKKEETEKKYHLYFG